MAAQTAGVGDAVAVAVDVDVDVDVLGWPLQEALAALAASGLRASVRRTAFDTDPPAGSGWRVVAVRRGATGRAACGPTADAVGDAAVELVAAAFASPSAAAPGDPGAAGA